MKKVFLFLLVVPAYFFSVAQSGYFVDSLNKQLSHSYTVPDKMYWLNQLACYYKGIDDNRSEQLGDQLITMADSSRNREWMIKALLYNADRLYEFGYVQQSVTRGLEYSQKAFDIAKSSNLDEYTCWAYLYLARG